jgi:hypothetical protein
VLCQGVIANSCEVFHWKDRDRVRVFNDMTYYDLSYVLDLIASAFGIPACMFCIGVCILRRV